MIVALACLLAGGQAVAQKSVLTAKVSGVEPGTRVLLLEVKGGNFAVVDTLVPDAKGVVSVVHEGQKEHFFGLALAMPQNPMVHVITLPKERVNLELEYSDRHGMLAVAGVKGSRNMEVYREFSQLLMAAAGDQSRQMSLAGDMEQLIGANSDVLMSAFLVTYFEQAFDQYVLLYKQVRDGLAGRYPDNDFVRHLDEKLRGVLLPGMEAPDIAMPGTDGREHRLSDLRGKVVLIDFWASWCRPCRMENPNVVRLYGKYHDRGFDIFSVSLDNSREQWLRAIEADGLRWENHVSDLRGWSSSGGRLYGVSSIPATVLVDADGKVLARNLRGEDLENKLKEIFGE